MTKNKPSKAAYKKCLVSALHRAKIATRKGARKAFSSAIKKCNALVPKKSSGKKPAHKKTRRHPRKQSMGSTDWHPRDYLSYGRFRKPRRKVGKKLRKGAKKVRKIVRKFRFDKLKDW